MTNKITLWRAPQKRTARPHSTSNGAFKRETQRTSSSWYVPGILVLSGNKISDLRDLNVNKILSLTSLDPNFSNLQDWSLGRKYWYHSEDPVQISIYIQFQRGTLSYTLQCKQFRCCVVQANNKAYIVWAYDSKGDSYGPNYFSRHTNRGSSGLAYDILASPSKPKATVRPSTANIAVKVVPQTKRARFDGNTFEVSWAYDSSAGKIRFDLEVQTKGWVAFGFAKQAPNSMRDYDVIVGGVLDSGQGYLYVSRASFFTVDKHSLCTHSTHNFT